MKGIDECFNKGLLRESTPNTDLAKKSLKQARFFLEQSEKLISSDMKEMAVLALYDSLFHISRSLLYKDGITERSHYCIAVYLKINYFEKGILSNNFLKVFESVMSIRHRVQYSLEKPKIDLDLDESFNTAEEYLKAVEELISK